MLTANTCLLVRASAAVSADCHATLWVSLAEDFPSLDKADRHGDNGKEK